MRERMEIVKERIEAVRDKYRPIVRRLQEIKKLLN